MTLPTIGPRGGHASQTARFAPPPFDRAGRCREHFFAGRLSTGTLCQRRGSHDGAISSRERRYGRWPALLPSEEWRPPRSDNSFAAARAGCDARGAFATFGPRWRTRDERWLQRSGGTPSAAPWTNVDPRHRMRTSVLKDGRHRRRLHDRRGRAPVVLEHRERGGGRAPQMHRRRRKTCLLSRSIALFNHRGPSDGTIVCERAAP